MSTVPKGYQALQATPIGDHMLGVPGRHEAKALTDCCPRADCLRPVQPAAVLDVAGAGKTTARCAAYRCPSCDAAWLCWWGPAQGRPDLVARNQTAQGGDETLQDGGNGTAIDLGLTDHGEATP